MEGDRILAKRERMSPLAKALYSFSYFRAKRSKYLWSADCLPNALLDAGNSHQVEVLLTLPLILMKEMVIKTIKNKQRKKND